MQDIEIFNLSCQCQRQYSCLLSVKPVGMVIAVGGHNVIRSLE